MACASVHQEDSIQEMRWIWQECQRLALWDMCDPNSDEDLWLIRDFRDVISVLTPIITRKGTIRFRTKLTPRCKTRLKCLPRKVYVVDMLRHAVIGSQVRADNYIFGIGRYGGEVIRKFNSFKQKNYNQN